MLRLLVMQVAVWSMMACGARSAKLPVSNRTSGPDVAAFVRRADQAFARLRPDYRRPFVQGPDVHASVSRLYLEACRVGHRRSCWMADGISHSERSGMRVRRNCLAGDVMSCRAIPAPPGLELDKRFPGWASRAGWCEGPECQKVLRQECAAGFPKSCWDLEGPSLDDHKPLRVRAVMLAGRGCRAGLLEECRWLVGHGPDSAEQAFARERVCTLGRERCERFYTFSDSPRARDLLEYGCQYARGRAQEIACGFAEAAYYVKGLAEPVPGRARALGTWNCEQLYHDPVKCSRDPALQWRNITP
jgi:hypothetical protein